jgi:putative addiction module component (TIGR02574 family)
MTVEQIETEVLKLPEQARAELVGRLMRSLADTSALEPDVADAWVQEVIRRDAEMESGAIAGIPAEEVFAELRSKGK